jgi:glycosyltransferase involved in cell wall biosynthesis
VEGSTASETALTGAIERASAATDRPLRILHLIIVLGPTNGQYNEHCLPLMHARELSICAYFKPQLQAPPEIGVFAGDNTLRGFFRALRGALASKEFDIVHAHSPHMGSLLIFNLAFRPWRWGLRRKLVYTVQDSYHDYKLRNKLLMLPPLAVFPRVVFCGHAAYDSYPALWKRLVGRRRRIVQNAADLGRVDAAISDLSPATSNSTFQVVSVGRLEKVKDASTLIAAFGRMGDEHSRLALVGAGSLRGDLVREIQASRLQDRIELTGMIPRDEVFTRCARADLFVSASHGEGLPVAVIEAMATGCPVVLSDIPPHREVAEGLDFVPFVRPGDVDGFAREIERFRGMSPEARRALGLKGQALVRDRFSLETMHAGLESVYRELV